MADYLKMPLQEFCDEYVKQVGNRHSLREYPVTYDCVFLRDNRCSIYPVRPKQCRTFPWWPEVVESKEAWEDTARRCEGICSEAETVPYEEIQSQLCAP